MQPFQRLVFDSKSPVMILLLFYSPFTQVHIKSISGSLYVHLSIDMEL